MPLIQIIVVLIVIGVLLWLVQSYIPLAPPFKQIITAVVVIFTVLWLLGLFFPSVWTYGPHVGRY